MRGKVSSETAKPGSTRIIPAGAGKRSVGQFADALDRDHPRGCGEKLSKVHAATRSGGSSPRVRGKGKELGKPEA